MSKRIPPVASASCAVLIIALVSAGLSGVTGCVKLAHKTPPANHYLLGVTPPAAAGPGQEASTSLQPVLAVHAIESDPPFDGEELLYRTSDTKWQQDYYNRFLATPGGMVTEAVRRWLQAAGPFGGVVGTGAPAEPDYALRGRLRALYGDYRTGEPAAVMEIEFTLTALHQQGNAVLLDRSYPAQVPLAGRSPADLVTGLNAALKDILTSLTADLREALRSRSAIE
jgi:cholesterol transport system auxiliary component